MELITRWPRTFGLVVNPLDNDISSSWWMRIWMDQTLDVMLNAAQESLDVALGHYSRGFDLHVILYASHEKLCGECLGQR